MSASKMNCILCPEEDKRKSKGHLGGHEVRSFGVDDLRHHLKTWHRVGREERVKKLVRESRSESRIHSELNSLFASTPDTPKTPEVDAEVAEPEITSEVRDAEVRAKASPRVNAEDRAVEANREGTPKTAPEVTAKVTEEQPLNSSVVSTTISDENVDMGREEVIVNTSRIEAVISDADVNLLQGHNTEVSANESSSESSSSSSDSSSSSSDSDDSDEEEISPKKGGISERRCSANSEASREKPPSPKYADEEQTPGPPEVRPPPDSPVGTPRRESQVSPRP